MYVEYIGFYGDVQRQQTMQYRCVTCFAVQQAFILAVRYFRVYGHPLHTVEGGQTIKNTHTGIPVRITQARMACSFLSESVLKRKVAIFCDSTESQQTKSHHLLLPGCLWFPVLLSLSLSSLSLGLVARTVSRELKIRTR